jgi:hypothetical protein
MAASDQQRPIAAAWAVWTIKPTLNRYDEGPGFLPDLLSFAEATVDYVSVGGVINLVDRF